MPGYYDSDFYSKPIEVINDDGNIMVITTDDFGRKSLYTWYNIKEKYSESHYINHCLLGGFLQDHIKKVLVIGAGGGAFIKYFEDHIPNACVTGIDIDETMIEIAKKELFIKTKNIIVGDASIGLDQLLDIGESFDLILFDVYGRTGEIPEDILNEVFLSQIQLLLNKTGVFSMNYSNFFRKSCIESDILRMDYYERIHQKIKLTFGREFIVLSSGEEDGDNISGVYNLDKKYNEREILNNYNEKVSDNKIAYDSMITQSIYVDEIGEYLL